MSKLSINSIQQLVKAQYRQRRVGTVESVTLEKVTGWLIDTDPARELKIYARGQYHTPSFRRVERSDVNAIFPQASEKPGFIIDIPLALRSTLVEEDLARLKVFYGSREIPSMPDAVNKFDSKQEAETGATTEVVQRGLFVHSPYLGKLDHALVELIIDGVKYPSVAIDDGGESVFEIPAQIWLGAKDAGLKVLQISVDHTVVAQVPVSQSNVLDYLSMLCKDDSPEQSHVLLGLAHLRYIAMHRPIPKMVVDWAVQEATRFKCLEQVTEHFGSALAQEALTIQVDPNADLHAKALTKIWNLFEKEDRPSAVVLDQVVMSLGLNTRQQTAVLESLTTYFCQADCFDEILYRLSEDRIAALARSESAWEVSLALPYLVARGRYKDAVAALSRLHECTGWINTECLLEASRRAFALNPNVKSRIEFLYALMSYLKNFEGNYWTRLYDRSMAGSLSLWFQDLQALPTWLQKDVVESAVRCFALSYDFWDQLPDCHVDTQANEGLDRAYLAYQQIDTLRSGEMSNDKLISALRAARYLVSVGNEDAKAVVREVALEMSVVCKGLSHLIDAAADALDALGESEQLRKLAHPELDSQLDLKRAAAASDKIAGLIAKSNDANRSSYGVLLRWVEREITSLAQGQAFDETACKSFIRVIKALDCDTGGWMSADLLYAAANAVGDEHGCFDSLIEAGKTSYENAMRVCAKPADHPSLHSAGSSQVSAGHNMQLRKGSQLHGDVLVVLYSCQKYLGDRIPLLRETWLARLKERGIPYIILVGNGDDSIDGDVLRLNVEDTYEALPSKTLRMIEWVYENTDFQYLVKIDDDCALNVDQFFSNLAYRKYNYRGRILRRNVGDSSRTWHQAKSQSDFAKNSFDRSPEPSSYCDGGSGYSLSRHAMRECLRASRSAYGQWLKTVSFMEDKLVGDLLKTANIAPHEESYYVHVLRRTHDGAKPVSMYSNFFFGSKSSPVSLVHLDEAKPLQEHLGYCDSTDLLPKRIWPSHRTLKISHNSHSLEYLSSEDKLSIVRDSSHVVISVLRNEMTMLPHFLDHYRKLGVGAFLIADNLSDDGSREYLLEQNDVALYSVDSEYKEAHFGVDWQQTLLSHHCLGKWVLLVDADEFLTFEGIQSDGISSVTSRLESQGFNAAYSHLVDMYPSGLLSECDFTKGAPFDLAPYHDNPPVKPAPGSGYFSNSGLSVSSALRHRLAPGSEPNLFTGNKVPLLRYSPTVKLSEGIHYVGNIKLSPDPMFLAHFKYHSGFAAKVEKEIQRKQHYGGAIEYQKYALMLREARDRLYNDRFSKKIEPTLRP
ncbi:glycosyltransferase family 2 protein [Thioclava sp. GXIMD2076]|uniref:glycosyltransferase family 2 protein n=1 Tax=Thioclava sp. GXIMD2076 TaxID=3131931 RepID=UPI0030CC6212